MNPSTLSFSQLKKMARTQEHGKGAKKIAIVADCATQHLATAITGCGASQNMPLAVFGLNEENSIANALNGKITGTHVTA